MKTPEDIKKCLEVCATLDGDCENCPYDGLQIFCTDRMRKDALAYIQQLESRIAQVERERDAAVADLHGDCEACKNGGTACLTCVHNLCAIEELADAWQWRGVCEENTKEE